MTFSHRPQHISVHILDRRPRSRHLYLVPERRVPREKYVPAGRALHLVDIENLMGGPEAGVVALHRAVSDYRDAVPITDGDHVVIGANPQLGVVAKACWQSARLVVGGGPDGADTALLGTVKDTDWVAARYDLIVVGSGDGIFEVVARKFRLCGLAVGVASRRGSLSCVLGATASFVRILPDVPIAEVSA